MIGERINRAKLTDRRICSKESAGKFNANVAIHSDGIIYEARKGIVYEPVRAYHNAWFDKL
jgi:hypothetical protein